MKKFEFVFVAKDNNFKITREQSEKFEFEHNNVTFNYVANNNLSLADVYNTFIQKHRIDKDIDYLIFMHADVSLDIEQLINHIESVDGKYDVIGLCGCSKMSINITPLNWWCASNPYPEHRWGCVTHGELGNQKSFFSSHSPNITDHEVACIDGLCIILTKNAIENSQILFDKNVRFNCYDTIFSLDAILNEKLKLGVLVEQSLYHYSVGKSILSDDFLKDEKYLRSKFNFEIPKNSKLEHLLLKNKI